MMLKGNRNVDVAPGLAEQLAKLDTSSLPAETTRSRLLGEIEEAIREFERDPEGHREQINELRELKFAFSQLSSKHEGAATLADTETQLAAIKAEKLSEVRGGNGSEEPEEPVPEPALAEAGSHALGEELAQAIGEVASRMASLDDERKKTALGKRLELLEVYQKVKTRDRNASWEQKVRETLARIADIERPARAYDLERARRAIQEEAPAPAEARIEVPEILPENKNQVIAQAQEALATIGRKLDMGKSSHIGRVLRFNLEQAQEKLAAASAHEISESGLVRVQAIVEKLQALAVGWERDRRKSWEREVQQRSFELTNALTHAMPTEQEMDTPKEPSPAEAPAPVSRPEQRIKIIEDGEAAAAEQEQTEVDRDRVERALDQEKLAAYREKALSLITETRRDILARHRGQEFPAQAKVFLRNLLRAEWIARGGAADAAGAAQMRTNVEALVTTVNPEAAESLTSLSLS